MTLRVVLNFILVFLVYYKYFARLLSFTMPGVEYGIFLVMLLYTFWRFQGNFTQIGLIPMVGMFCLGITLNASLSIYVQSIFQFSFSAMVYLLPVLTYLVFSSIRVRKICVHQQLKDFSLIILFSILHAWVIVLILGPSILGPLPSGFIPHKDVGYVGVWASIMCIYAYCFRSKHKYYSIFIFIIGLSYILQANLIKSLFGLMLGVSLNLVFQSQLKVSRIYALVFANTVVLAVILLNDGLRLKIDEYLHFYITDDNALDSPRNALYLASFRMLTDYFPWGVGVGSFGSYGAMLYQSLVYFDYNLIGIHGLNNFAQLDSSDNFLMDVFWSSAIGELGLINMVVYLVLILLPLVKLSQSRVVSQDFKRFVLLSFLLIAIQSLVLAVFMQISFVFLIYCLVGLSVDRR